MSERRKLTPRECDLIQQALRMTNAPKDPTHPEIARALMEAAEQLEASDSPDQGSIDEMRTLLREGFLAGVLSELSAREARKMIKLIDPSKT